MDTFWIIVISLLVGYWFYSRLSKPSNIVHKATVENYEEWVKNMKQRLFELEHFDSPHFIDYQNAFDHMEVNYLRLKQRKIHNQQEVLEIAKDWGRYMEALTDLKHARAMLDVDWSDDAWDNAEQRFREPSIIKEEVEKKFKALLESDWTELPKDYFTRSADDKWGKWEKFYLSDSNYQKMKEKREKKEKEKGIKYNL